MTCTIQMEYDMKISYTNTLKEENYTIQLNKFLPQLTAICLIKANSKVTPVIIHAS